MQIDNLGMVEKKVLGALLIMADDNNMVETTLDKIAETINYKRAGGALTFALRILEIHNFIVKVSPRRYKILV